MEIFFEAAAIAILLIIGAGIIIRNNSPSAKYRKTEEDARIEFDRIARDKDFFNVICLYVDEQGKRMMTSSMCGKKYLVRMVKKQRYGGLM